MCTQATAGALISNLLSDNVLCCFDKTTLSDFDQSTTKSGQKNKQKGKAMKQMTRTPTPFALGAAILLALGMSTLAARAAETKTVTGEVVDLMCYLDHGAKGEKHASCAQMCIKSGGPVGILTADNKLYLIIGEHKPINDQLEIC